MANVRPRILMEWLLRAVAAGIFAVLLWRSLHPPIASRSAQATELQLAELLPRWTAEGAPDSVTVRLQSTPDARSRDWMAALRRAGTSVAWYSDSIVPSVVSAEPMVDPAGGVLVRVGAVRGAPVVLADEGGIVDSATVGAGAASFRLAALAGNPAVRSRGQLLSASVMDTVRLRRVLVLGRVGWEAKFTIAALEERGWLVDTKLLLSPGNFVQQGPLGSIDTARYAAVVVLDSVGASNPGSIARYANDGGGVVIAGNAARVTGFQALLPGRAGNRIVPKQRLTDTSETEGARHAIVGLKSDALLLERDDSINTVAARRVGAGRVIQLADEETWRQRMRRGPEGEVAHREWWARVIGSVAYAPRLTIRPPSDESAPLASLVATLGPPVSRPVHVAPLRDRNTEGWLLIVAMLALLTEWTSRRWRGAP